MVSQYDDMQGDETNPREHPATNMPQASQHYAGDVIAMPMGMGQISNAIRGQTMNSLGSLDPKFPTDKTNVVPIPKKPK